MARQDNYLWKLDKFFGGESEDDRIGRNPGSFREGTVGFDIHSSSGKLQVAKKPVKDSGSVIVDVIKWIEINPSNGDMYAYGEDAIYKETGGTYTLTHPLSSGTPNGEGLCDFDGYLYYRWDDKLGRFDYNSTWTDSWQTGLEVVDFSPMLRFKNYLMVGHGRYIGTVDDVGTWDPDRLTLPPGYFARSIFKVGRYSAILATRGSSISGSEEGHCFLWDGTSQNYIDDFPVTGNPHAGIALGNKLVWIAGSEPVIQKSLGGIAEDIHVIPNVGVGKTAEVWPGAIDVWRNKVHFGISDGTSTTVKRVVRTYGAKSSGFPDAVNPEFPMSSGSQSGDSVQITAVKRIGTTIRFACRDGNDKWIDEVDTTLLQANATYRSLAFDNDSPFTKVPPYLCIELVNALAANESVRIRITNAPYSDPTFSTSSNYVEHTETTVGTTLIRVPLASTSVQIRSRDLAIEVYVGGSAATKPEIKRVWIPVDEETDSI